MVSPQQQSTKTVGECFFSFKASLGKPPSSHSRLLVFRRGDPHRWVFLTVGVGDLSIKHAGHAGPASPECLSVPPVGLVSSLSLPWLWTAPARVKKLWHKAVHGLPYMPVPSGRRGSLSSAGLGLRGQGVGANEASHESFAARTFGSHTQNNCATTLPFWMLRSVLSNLEHRNFRVHPRPFGANFTLHCSNQVPV